MGTVAVTLTFPGSVHEAERCWYDTSRWPAWVDGLQRVVEVGGDWPAAGSEVHWESGPAGRGHVRERVLEYEQLGGQRLSVEDDSMRAVQSISFTPAGEGVAVRLGLDYEIKRRSIFTALVDALFIRRAMAASLRRTLSRFGSELAADRSRV